MKMVIGVPRCFLGTTGVRCGSELGISAGKDRQVRYNEGPDYGGGRVRYKIKNLHDQIGGDESTGEFPFLFNKISMGDSSDKFYGLEQE